MVGAARECLLLRLFCPGGLRKEGNLSLLPTSVIVTVELCHGRSLLGEVPASVSVALVLPRERKPSAAVDGWFWNIGTLQEWVPGRSGMAFTES